MSCCKSLKGAHASLEEAEKVSQRKVNSDPKGLEQKKELADYGGKCS